MTIDEIKTLTLWMQEQGVASFQVLDSGVSVVFRLDKPRIVCQAPNPQAEVTPKAEPSTQDESFDGMDMGTLLYSAG